MEFNEKIKKELEERIKKLENIITDRGIGSKQLHKARAVQRNLNLAVFVGSVITVAGIAVWLFNRSSEED